MALWQPFSRSSSSNRRGAAQRGSGIRSSNDRSKTTIEPEEKERKESYQVGKGGGKKEASAGALLSRKRRRRRCDRYDPYRRLYSRRTGSDLSTSRDRSQPNTTPPCPEEIFDFRSTRPIVSFQFQQIFVKLQFIEINYSFGLT